MPYVDFDLEGNFVGLHFYNTYIDHGEQRVIFSLGGKEYPLDNAVRDITTLVDRESGEEQSLEADLLAETFRVDRATGYLLKLH